MNRWRTGIVVTRSQIGSYGQGFHTATEPDPCYGEATVRVAVRLRRPVVGHADDVGAVVDELVTDLFGYGAPLTPGIARAVRAELRRRGYDGIIARDAGGSSVDYVIALDGASVKVVVS
jgi:hypothetical protein